jgi:hypothetical protein
MPNRILRDWTDSESIDNLTVHAERFFTRLIMKVDDYGRYNANIKILKSTLFPLKTDIREPDITRWLAECKATGLIVLYSVAQKDYLQIENFKQVLRQKLEKFPAPNMHSTCIADASQMNSSCFPEKKGNEVEEEKKVDRLTPTSHTQDEMNLFNGFKEWINKNAPRVNQMKEPFTIDQYLKLKEKLSKELVQKLLFAMQNYEPLHKKSRSAYLTILNWSKREQPNDSNKQTTEQPSINEILKESAKQ